MLKIAATMGVSVWSHPIGHPVESLEFFATATARQNCRMVAVVSKQRRLGSPAHPGESSGWGSTPKVWGQITENCGHDGCYRLITNRLGTRLRAWMPLFGQPGHRGESSGLHRAGQRDM